MPWGKRELDEIITPGDIDRWDNATLEVETGLRERLELIEAMIANTVRTDAPSVEMTFREGDNLQGVDLLDGVWKGDAINLP